ncbi:hypothetical protein IV203_020969 [Nitzschia inconspicua]|uniref:Uncharacterized protein n=1 Tax=Nitzschia inconspicua TaxID=303405 RepID=A0A9K3KFZ1_9STRA|nr:hypothetical protein IV203_020969 [Nitzschia inconspicua]
MSSITSSSGGVTTNQQQLATEEGSNLTVEGYIADKSSATSSTSKSDENEDKSEDKLGLVIDVLQPKRQRRRQSDNGSSSDNSINSSSRSLTHVLMSAVDERRLKQNRRKRRRSKSTHHNSRKHARTFDATRAWESLSMKSPIHPDIDITLTEHIAIKNDLLSPSADSVLLGAAAVSSATNSCFSTTEIVSAVPALSNAVLQYFAGLRNEISARTSKMSGKSIASKQPAKSSVESDRTSYKPNVVLPKTAQIISDVASFSDQPYCLEDALDLTDTPRLLLEATSPYRVIHVNAAFSRNIIAAANGSRKSTAQEWIESQNQPHKISSKNRTLQEALEDIIPENVTVPLTCHPVLGAGSITHYLIEATSTEAFSGNNARQRIKGSNENNVRPEEGEGKDISNSKTNEDMRRNTMQLYKHYEAVG